MPLGQESVSLGRSETLVSQEVPCDGKTVRSHEVVAGERMPEIVETEVAETGQPYRLGEAPLDEPCVHREHLTAIVLPVAWTMTKRGRLPSLVLEVLHSQVEGGTLVR